MNVREFRIRGLVRAARERHDVVMSMHVVTLQELLDELTKVRAELSDREGEVARLQLQHRRLIDFKSMRGGS